MQPILDHNNHEHLSIQVYQQVGRKNCHCKSKNKVLTAKMFSFAPRSVCDGPTK